VVKTLDAANERLELTMDNLRSTIVEASFRPEDEEPRSLLDFVDEQDVETRRDKLKESIRESNVSFFYLSCPSFLTSIQEARTEFDTSILAFDNDLRALKSAMTASTKISSSQSQSRNFVSTSPIPESLNALETHAQEMAHLLDSLNSHFDLCVNAIRHTEGGFAAVRKAASSLPPGAEPVSVSGVMNAESQNLNDEPMSDEERTQMLQVLENDAAQVQDVVAELREHLSEMETKHEAILEHVAALTTEYSSTTAAFTILENISANLPGYIMASSDFRLHWEETKQLIREQLEDLEGMRVFYENYHASYDAMILEVHRRKKSEDKVKAIMRKAMEQIEEESAIDMRERVAFKGDVGDYIPQDLWSGVSAHVPKWEFVQTEGNGSETPRLERTVVDAAKGREKQRQGR
jgi:autophagy-related protein 17